MQERLERLRQGLWRSQPRLTARHAEWSAIASTDDLTPAVPDDLVDLALRAATRARAMDLSRVAARATDALSGQLVGHWPGEHYRLLGGLAQELRPVLAIEVGTYTGMGALSLLEGVGPEGRVLTYDVVPWHRFPGTLLRQADFDGRIEQRVLDLQDGRSFAAELPALREAELLFVDGPKDGRFEPRLMSRLVGALRGSGTVVVLDDIRLMAMVRLWRELPLARLDVTSFGHWSGTGMCVL